MRVFFPVLTCIVVLCTDSGQAQEDATLVSARAGIEKLRALVESGAVARVELQRAEDALADTQDNAVLRRAMYSTDLTAAQADEMVAAAQRRLDRRERQLQQARHLVDSGLAARAELDHLAQEAEYARQEYDLAVARANLSREMAATPAPASARQPDGAFTTADFERVEAAFEHRFGKPLPVSAMGDTAVHRALGFDHRGRVDVAVNPGQPEGIWLREYLTARHIPYFAFSHAVPGKATGAHIHMGPMSTRLAPTAAAD